MTIFGWKLTNRWPMPVFRLSDELVFPPPSLATAQGLLAVGGDLSVKRLVLAYRMGIFPWFCEGEPILWWSPDPRLVLFPPELRVSRSLGKTIRQHRFQITMDVAFERVIAACSQRPLANDSATWITEEMITAYTRLHAAGYAHSVEAWQGRELVGGLYGVSLGGCFFGESMFTRVSNASKSALVSLVKVLQTRGFDMIDCQVETEHLKRFGAREIPRQAFIGALARSLERPTWRGCWAGRAGLSY